MLAASMGASTAGEGHEGVTRARVIVDGHMSFGTHAFYESRYTSFLVAGRSELYLETHASNREQEISAIVRTAFHVMTRENVPTAKLTNKLWWESSPHK